MNLTGQTDIWRCYAVVIASSRSGPMTSSSEQHGADPMDPRFHWRFRCRFRDARLISGTSKIRGASLNLSSEHQLQRELELPRGGGRIGNLSGRLAVTVVGAVALEDNLIREREIRVIENIERFRAELQRHALPDGDPLKKGRVEVEQARPAERTAPRVPESAGKRHRESTGIEPAFPSPYNH